MRDLFGAVDVAAVLDDVQAPLIVEVHIDIGHLGALWREEALEEQVVFERVETRDAEGVRHDGARGRTAARPHADPVLACPVGKLLHDQEVGREALLADDLVLVLEALDDVHALGQISVALLEAAQRHLLEQRLVGLVFFEERVARQDDVAELDGDVALVRNLERGRQALRMVLERLGHLLGALEVELVVLELHAVGVAHVLAHADAQHEVLRIGVFLLEVVDVVGADDLQPHLVGEADEHVVDLALGQAAVGGDFGAVVLDLDVEVFFAEQVAEGLRPLLGDLVFAAVDGLGNDARNAGRGGDEPLVVFLEHLERGARTVVEAVDRGLGDEVHEVSVALVVLGEQDHVVELGALVARERGVGREVDLAADDGLDARLDGGKVELRAAVHVAVVGDGDGGHAELLGALAQRPQAGATVEQRVLRVVVEMHEGAGVTAGVGCGPLPQRRGLYFFPSGDVFFCHSLALLVL